MEVFSKPVDTSEDDSSEGFKVDSIKCLDGDSAK